MGNLFVNTTGAPAALVETTIGHHSLEITGECSVIIASAGTNFDETSDFQCYSSTSLFIILLS